MKFKNIIAVVFIMAFAVNVNAQSNQFSLGANILTSTGLSAKYGLTNNTALTGMLGFSLYSNSGAVYLQGNYNKYGSIDAFDVESGLLRYYYGGGVNVTMGNNGNAGIGGRIPLGLEYILEGAPLEIYMDLAPTLDVLPNTHFYLGGSLGLRYIF